MNMYGLLVRVSKLEDILGEVFDFLEELSDREDSPLDTDDQNYASNIMAVIEEVLNEEDED